MVIGSGFPCLFLGYSPFDHFCAPCSCLFTYSHILRCFFPGFVSVFLFCEPLCLQLPQYPCVSFPGFFLAFRLPFTSQHSGIQFLLRRFFRASILSISSFFSLQRSTSTLHTVVSQYKSGSGPWRPIFFIIVDVCFVRFPPCPDNVIPKLLVREGHFFLPTTIGPRASDLAIELLHNSIPQKLLETTVISFTPLPT